MRIFNVKIPSLNLGAPWHPLMHYIRMNIDFPCIENVNELSVIGNLSVIENATRRYCWNSSRNCSRYSHRTFFRNSFVNFSRIIWNQNRGNLNGNFSNGSSRNYSRDLSSNSSRDASSDFFRDCNRYFFTNYSKYLSENSSGDFCSNHLQDPFIVTSALAVMIKQWLMSDLSIIVYFSVKHEILTSFKNMFIISLPLFSPCSVVYSNLNRIAGNEYLNLESNLNVSSF